MPSPSKITLQYRLVHRALVASGYGYTGTLSLIGFTLAYKRSAAQWRGFNRSNGLPPITPRMAAQLASTGLPNGATGKWAPYAPLVAYLHEALQ
jgi:hypothetical protein